MKSIVYRILFVLSLLTWGFFNGQATTLGVGDIAITGYNSDTNNNDNTDRDEFVFVLLTDISGTTVISFTDNGWQSSGSFRTGEGIVTLTISKTYSCGTEIRLDKLVNTWSAFDDTGASAGIISQTGDLDLSSSGDQLFAFNGSSLPNSETDPNFVAAIDFEGSAGWDANASNANTSDLPTIFVNNSGTSFSVAHMDNGKFNCTGANSITSGLPADIRANIYTATNWQFENSGSARFDFTIFCNFTCTSVCTDPVISSLTTNSTIGSNTFCPGDAVIFSITGTKGDATTWNLYSGSCGGTIVGSTPAVDGTTTITLPSITASATYFVGGTGGCVATPTCTSINITVNGLTANAGSDQKISGSTTANISGNGSGTWTIIEVGDGNGYFGAVPGTTSSTMTSTTFNGTAGQEYKLRWTVTNASCPSSTADVVITFFSPTTLGLGDIAFTGYHSDAPDEFRFVLLTDIKAGTTITFTENGWQNAGGFRSGERTIVYEFCRPYSCGDEFSATASNGLQDDEGENAATILSGSFLQLSASGDQIFAYQGTAPTTGSASNWIAAIQMNGVWDADATTSENSAQPSAFTDGVNSISISPEVQNAAYDCSITTNSPANLRTAVNTASNWSGGNAPISLAFCDFTCGSCIEPVLMASDVSAPATACPGQTVALTINGSLNGANEWAIYSGNCGGTLVGTTTSSSFNVTPTATTTYYVSGRGGCVVTESCQTATISVTSVQADAGPNDVEKINGSNSTILQANGGFGDGTWSIVDSSDEEGSFSDKNDPVATFSGNAGQFYTLKWTIHNTGCPDTEDEVTIVFLDQTGLTLGDIAFISYSADEDDFAFVLLKDVNAGTSIKFTDRGWLAAGGFRAGEGTITVEFCRPYSCGDEFNIFNAPHEIKDVDGLIAGTITGSPLQPSTSGDQIFAYQGPETNLITGIQMNGAWDTDATNTNTSAKPAVFTDGVNSISIAPAVDNAYLDCNKVTVATGSQINNSTNWIPSNTNSAALPLDCNLACCTPGVATSISGSSGPLCPSSLQTLSVVGNLNDDQNWVWYTGSCGGTEVATGANFNVSPTTTTTYYVRAEGTCSGTSGACASFTITVEDGVNPVPTCPADINVNNDPGQCSAVVNFTATGTDNCGGTVDISYSQNPGTAFNVGTTTVNVTAEDESGNTSNCSFDVIVTDNEGPTGTCNDMTLDLAANGQVNFNVFAAGGLTNRADNCGLSGTVGVTGPTLFTCADLGPRPVTIFNRDINGNETPCTVTLTINDPLGVCNQPPVAMCQSISVSADLNSCETTITAAQINNGSSDPDGDPLSYSLDNNGPFAVGGPYTVELTVSDGSLMDKCTAQVTVTDDQAPSFSNCPGNISVGNDTGDCGADVSWTPPTLNDNCPAVSSNSSHDPGDFFPIGSTTVTYTGSDAAGNDATACSFTVTVNDTEAPTFSNCPGNISVSNDAGDCGADVNWTPPLLNDNCPGASSSSTHDPGDFFPVGSTIVTYSGSDAADNDAADCVFTVTVNDTEAPTFGNCPGNISVGNDTGDCGADVSWTPPTFDDNCPGAINYATHTPGSFFDVGTTTVTYSGVDAAGNTATNCVFTVTVDDTEAPSFSNCPGNITLPNSSNDCGSVASWTPPTLSDNCPGATANSSHDPGEYFPVGTTTVTYSGMDAADNAAATCSFTVTINDEEKPKITCPANITTSNDPGMCGAEVNFTTPDASDNCELKEVKARYRMVDQNNSPTGSWTSRVFDPSGFFPVGRYQVQWRAEDIYGNKKSCSHYLEVFDGEAPVAVCKNVTVDFNGEQDINLTVAQVWDESASSDNCGTVEFVSADLTIGCEELGNTVAIPVTIQDGAGNVDDCTAYVDVIGLPCGWAEGPNDGSLNCDGQTTSDYDVDDESFTLTSDGCWHDCRDADRATYVYHPLCGDGTLTAKLASINTSGYAGLMARESLDPWARRAGVLKNYSTRRVRREWRASYGGIVAQSQSNRSRVKWLRIVRKGNEIKSYTSTNGSYWRLLYKVTFPNLEDCIYVGMTAYSLNGNAKVSATFEDVTLSGSGSLAGGIFNDNPGTAFTPEGIQAWGNVGNVGNGTIEVFPNPASNQAQIVLDGFADEAAQLVVRDAFGKVVRQIDLDSALGVVMPLEVQDLAPGVYLISLVQSERLVISKRLVIQK